MKAMGISAMVIAIVMIFLPFGGFGTAIASILAIFAWGEGKTFGAVAIIIGFINTLVLSPAVWMSEGGANLGGEMGAGTFMVLLHIGSGIGLWLMDKKKGVASENLSPN